MKLVVMNLLKCTVFLFKKLLLGMTLLKEWKSTDEQQVITDNMIAGMIENHENSSDDENNVYQKV